MRVLGYTRVSTREQASNGVSLEGQRRAIREECRRRGWPTPRIIEDAGHSGKDLKRPGMAEVLSLLDPQKRGALPEADALVVAKLDRLSRSILDFAGLLELAQRRGFAVVILDLGVDTTTPAGELLANVVAATAQWERKMIGQRTKDALAIKRSKGVVLGRPQTVPEVIAQRIRRERKRGSTYPAIADGLNADSVPTGQGGKRWYPATVHKVANRPSPR